MRHRRKGKKLKRTTSHRRALMISLATALFEHKKIKTTEAKAKALRPYAEKLITKAKKALQRESENLLPEGQSIDIHNRRLVYREIKNKAVLQELFEQIAPKVEDRNGGYIRIVKAGTRRGDGSKTAIVELVDWSAPQDGAVKLKAKKKKQQVKPEVEEETVEEEAVETEETEGAEETEEGEEKEEAKEEKAEDKEETKTEAKKEKKVKEEEKEAKEEKAEEATEEKESKVEKKEVEEEKTEETKEEDSEKKGEEAKETPEDKMEDADSKEEDKKEEGKSDEEDKKE